MMNKYARIQKNYPKFLEYYIFTILMNVLFIRSTGLILSFVETIILTGAVLLYRKIHKIPIEQIEQLKAHEEGLKVLLISVNTNAVFICLIFDIDEWKFMYIPAMTYLAIFYFLLPFFLKKEM